MCLEKAALYDKKPETKAKNEGVATADCPVRAERGGGSVHSACLEREQVQSKIYSLQETAAC